MSEPPKTGSRISRRHFISLGSASLISLAARCDLGMLAPLLATPPLPDWPFTLGVASGDPLADRVILWTRLVSDPLAADGLGGMPQEPIPVIWEIALDEAFASVVGSGVALAHPSLAHSVHVDAAGLTPATSYWYRFHVGSWTSPVARTRTLPAPGSQPDRVRFASASCQNYAMGHYTAHQHLAQEDLDFVVFLGDYIYEGGETGPIRSHEGSTIFSLADYRRRHALYRSDANLQAAHAAFPWIVTWDDHEVHNNHFDNPSSGFLARQAVAYQAWYEHMPARVLAPKGPALAIHRGFAWGDLLSMFVLDTRQHRTQQECGDAFVPPCEGFPGDDGDLLGPQQEAWLLGGLGASSTIWNTLAQQIVFSPTPIGTILNYDQWDGYPHSRERILAFLGDAEVDNPVVLTGDIHMSAAGRIPRDTVGLTDPIGSELVATGISSYISNPVLRDIAEQAIGVLPHVDYINAQQQGYIRHTVERDLWTADFRLVDTVLQPESDIATATSFVIPEGDFLQVP